MCCFVISGIAAFQTSTSSNCATTASDTVDVIIIPANQLVYHPRHGHWS
jgi:hypothetical protein